MKILKPLWILCGSLAAGIGIVGIFLPILPTTPLLLLAAFCYAKGSRRLDTWFRNTKVYKNHLEEFEKNRAMTLKTKFSILIPASIMLIFAFIGMSQTDNMGTRIGRITVAIMFVAKYVYFFTRIKTIPPSPQLLQEKIKAKRAREQKTVNLMIQIYCKGSHGSKTALKDKTTLCPHCKELADYAKTRLEYCPHIAEKTFCSLCTTHCYEPEMRQKIRQVMRYSGPRMMLYNPIMAVEHLAQTLWAKFKK